MNYNLKKILFLFVFTIIVTINKIYSQSNTEKSKDSINLEFQTNPDFFLLGTFSDYMGRFYNVDRETQIDRYYPYEESLAIYISEFIQKNYNLKTNLLFKETRHSEIYSPILANQLHTTYFDNKGNFINEKLDTDQKKYSYLLGLYYRYGEQLEGNIYKIQIANSFKDKQLYKILKELNCDKIVYKFLRGNLPASHILYFQATPQMINLFDIINKKHIELIKDRNEQLFGYIYKSEHGKELKEKDLLQKNELIKSLQLIFK